jgi:hypothetical protein
VRGDFAVRISQCLERGNLLALHGDEAREHDIEQECRHAEENRRDDDSHRLKLRQLVLDEPVGQLIGARHGAQASVAGEETVDRRHRLRLGRASHQRERRVVERAFHVERRGKRAMLHPEDAEPRVVRHDFARANRVDVFRRQRDADDAQLTPAAVDGRADAVAGQEPVREGEPLAGEHLVHRFRPPPPAEKRLVQNRLLARGNRDEPSRGGFDHPGNVERDIHDDACRHPRDARDGGKVVSHAERRALDHDEHVGKAEPVVVGSLGEPHRVEGAEIRDEHRDTGRDDQADRQPLAAGVPEVTQELP